MFKERSKEEFKPAVNWNDIRDQFTELFWNQNIRQFWIDTEIPLTEDKNTWKTLSADEQDVYKKVTGGLTLLDTEQASLGMPEIALKVDDLRAKAILNFMGMMEHMHAKSYSSIFSTLCSTTEIDEIFAWLHTQPQLQKKIKVISAYYTSIKDNESLYMAMSASVFLESFLFYSGFFYPLYLAGQGKLVSSGEIINLIIRDESIHGVYTGILAQEIFKSFNDSTKKKLTKQVNDLLVELYEIEIEYTTEIYTKIGLVGEVLKFIQYNADKALMNLGHDPHFNIKETDVNAVVIRGLDTKTKNHDFFSTKGNGYIKTTNVVETTDDDFDF
ncbi:MAG: class 1b ribonucleoside-diphosphate reductase subunit beta [Firmicutes bacterium]|nr:class 1b ribonucleoside-diphosphate reductase subunit beta [Bacillota bacterium]